MSLAAKHFDPQLGLDIHLYTIPPSPIPVPLPTPHISLVMDPFDYLPFIGGTVHVGGVKRATAGTGGLAVHIPVGGLWMPPFRVPGGPQWDDEIFMGSMTVVADGDPLSRIGMPVLDCNIVGMIPPFRAKKPTKPHMSLTLPMCVNLAIPSSVHVGGPPMISIAAMAFKGAFAGLGALKRTKAYQRAANAFVEAKRARFKDMPSGFLKCKVLRAEPVDIRSGSVVVSHEDFAIPGRLPLAWTRCYSTKNDRRGACGHGWESPADIRLEIEPHGTVLFHDPSGTMAVFPSLPSAPGPENQVLELVDGARLTWLEREDGDELQVRVKGDLVYAFTRPAVNLKPLHQPLRLPIQRIEDLCGNHWAFERDGTRLLRIVESGLDDLRGRYIDVHAPYGFIQELQLHDPATGVLHPLVKYKQDEHGDLIAAFDPLDAPRTFGYDRHHMVRHTDRVGLSFYYAYDDEWKVVHAWGDGGLHDYHFRYDALLRETEIRDSLGHTSFVKFDENDLPLCEIDPLDGVTILEYDEVGRTTAVVDPAGLRTEFAYDERGNLTTLTRPDDTTVQTEYDESDRPTLVTDPHGAQWAQRWDERGLLAEQRTPLGAASRYEYDTAGQLRAHTNPRGAVTRLAFDRHGLLLQITDALGKVSQFQHDALGRLLLQTNAAGQGTRYHYDPKGRMLEAKLPSGTEVKCAYDAEDQLTHYLDESGAETRLEYVGIGQIARRIQPDGHSVRYTYNTEEQLTGVINQRGETYTLKRDPLGRIVEEVDYWDQGRRYDYNPAGHLRRSVDPLGRIVTFETDKLGRIVKKTLPDSHSPGQQTHETFRYDKSGSLIELRNPVSHVTRNFDAEGRLVKEEQNGFAVENTYDLLGSRTERKTSAGNTVVVAYDLLNQPERITINDAAPITIERDALGRAVAEQLSPHLKRTLSYNDQGLLSAQSVEKDHAPLFETRFDYDRAGNLTRRKDSQIGTDTYRYDPMGRVLEHTDPTGKLTPWLNDPAGDRLRTRIKSMEMRQTAGGEGQAPLTWVREGEFDGVHYVFDRAGNLTQRSHVDEPGTPTLHLAWDANQRLTESTWVGGQRNGQTTRYGYDPLGRRVFKRNPTETTWFFWDGDALLGEVAQANSEASAPERVPVKADNVVDLIAARHRIKALKALHPSAREYAYRPGGFEPLALIDRRAAQSLASDAKEMDEVRRPHEHQPPTKPVAASVMQVTPPASQGSSSMRGLGLGVSLGQLSSPPTSTPTQVSDPSIAQPTGVEPVPKASDIGLSGGLGLGRMRLDDDPLGRPSPLDSDLVRPAGQTQAIGPIEIKEHAESPHAEAQESPCEAGAPVTALLSSVFLYQNDPNGCPTRLLDSGGNTVWAVRYTTWGQVAQTQKNLIPQPIRFQGQQCDEETGLHYNRHRYYDTHAGQYIGQDAVGLEGGLNLYSYGANPISWIDPLGLTGDIAKATHITYVGVKDGKPYVGYASMPGHGRSPAAVLRYRYKNDFGAFDVEPRAMFVGNGREGKDTARGLEQRYFEAYEGLNRDGVRADGTSWTRENARTANQQNPVGKDNGRRTEYLAAADAHRAGHAASLGIGSTGNQRSNAGNAAQGGTRC